MKKKLFVTSLVVLLLFNGFSKDRSWKTGIVAEEFIYEQAPFPSCHASTIAETTAGTMIISFFGGTRERDPDVCIYVCRKVDGKWSNPVEVANGLQSDGTRLPAWNPVLYQVPGGELQLYYKIGAHPTDWQGWMVTSDNDGLSWSAPRMLPSGSVGPVKNKPVLIGNKLFCPSSDETDGWKVHFEVTSDFGKTWRTIGPINDGKQVIAIQPSILTYKNGNLQVLCRSKNRAVLESWSTDGGETWSNMVPTILPNNNSGTDAVSLSDGKQLLVYNHVLPPGTAFKGIRTPINVALTENGRDWSAALVLDNTPESEFSYPSVIQTQDQFVHIVYTWNRTKIKHVVIDPSKLVLTPILDQQWPE